MSYAIDALTALGLLWVFLVLATLICVGCAVAIDGRPDVDALAVGAEAQQLALEAQQDDESFRTHADEAIAVTRSDAIRAQIDYSREALNEALDALFECNREFYQSQFGGAL